MMSRAIRGRAFIATIALAALVGVDIDVTPEASAEPRAATGRPAGAPTVTPSFDHDTTRFPLTGMHQGVNCESCHSGGVFAGTPVDCRSCHAGAEDRAQTRASWRHIPIQTDCADCHTTRFWEPARMEHGAVGDRCEQCHVGNMATGKPANHISSSNQCGECHGVGAWTNARFDHSGVSGNCVSCHDNRTAEGKPNDHIPSSDACELCHSTRAWTPATNFDHTGITTGCHGCHDGNRARGKDNDHIASSNDCELCHSTTAWTPATAFDHSNVTPGTCAGCHNGTTATGTPQGHFSSGLSCDACHSIVAWNGPRYMHTGNYPGDHRVSLDCTDCHGGNSATVTWSAPAYQPDCAGCHASDYRPNVDRHGNRTVSENRDCGNSGCHSVRDREW